LPNTPDQLARCKTCGNHNINCICEPEVTTQWCFLGEPNLIASFVYANSHLYEESTLFATIEYETMSIRTSTGSRMIYSSRPQPDIPRLVPATANYVIVPILPPEKPGRDFVARALHIAETSRIPDCYLRQAKDLWYYTTRNATGTPPWVDRSVPPPRGMASGGVGHSGVRAGGGGSGYSFAASGGSANGFVWNGAPVKFGPIGGGGGGVVNNEPITIMYDELATLDPQVLENLKKMVAKKSLDKPISLKDITNS